jgi:hypothetical protein
MSRISKAVSISNLFNYINGQFSIRFIDSVFKRSDPSTIRRLIIPVIVNAVNLSVFKGLFSHVIKEILKRVQPFFANSNTSSSVSIIFMVIRIVASAFKVYPHMIFGGISFAVNNGIISQWITCPFKSVPMHLTISQPVMIPCASANFTNRFFQRLRLTACDIAGKGKKADYFPRGATPPTFKLYHRFEIKGIGDQLI